MGLVSSLACQIHSQCPLNEGRKHILLPMPPPAPQPRLLCLLPQGLLGSVYRYKAIAISNPVAARLSPLESFKMSSFHPRPTRSDSPAGGGSQARACLKSPRAALVHLLVSSPWGSLQREPVCDECCSPNHNLGRFPLRHKHGHSNYTLFPAPRWPCPSSDRLAPPSRCTLPHTLSLSWCLPASQQPGLLSCGRDLQLCWDRGLAWSCSLYMFSEWL